MVSAYPYRIRLHFLVLLTLFVSLIPSDSARAASIVAGPYLQNVTKTGITIVFETSAKCRGRVWFGRRKGDFSRVVEAKRRKVHELRLEGLKQGAKYYYLAACKGATSAVHTFRTAARRGEAFRFAAYGDSRSHPDRHRMVAQAIRASKPNFAIHMGDLVSTGEDYDAWHREFFEPMAEVMAEVPLFPCLGNHEHNASHYYDFFSLPGNEAWYSFVYGDATFIALDTNQRFSRRSEQCRWLTDELKRADTIWTFVFFHHPAYSSGSHGCTPPVLKHLVPLLAEHNVDLVFAGHDHTYERTFPIVRSEKASKGTIFVVTGGGGARCYPVTPKPWTAYAESTLHHCVVDVDGAKLSLKAVRPDGEIFDSLTLDKRERGTFPQTIHVGESERMTNDERPNDE